MSLGTLIVIDGIDGSGKSSLARRLSQAFSSSVESFVSREPTDGAWGSQLRQSAIMGRHNAAHERHLLTMDRREHVRDTIQPAIERGAVVVLDRYVYSTAAYQSSSDEEALDILEDQFSFAPIPYVTIIIDAPVSTALARIVARGSPADHFERTETLERCRRIFTGVVALRPEVSVIDGSGSQDEVFAATIHHLFRQCPRLRKLCSALPAPVFGSG